MQVVLSERVKIALATLGRDDRDRVQTWFGYLRGWRDDPFVRSRSVTLNVEGRPVSMFRTSTDIRIFYTVDEQDDTVNVIDIATTDTILSFGHVPAGAS